MNKKEFKASVSEAFKSKNYREAFNKLLTLSHHEIAHLLNKRKWLKKSDISNFFWSQYCLEYHELVFTKASSETILNWYFKCKKPNSTLEEMLVDSYPATFVKAIKRNRAFIDSKTLERIKNYKWPEQFSVDVLAWIELNKEHHRLQNEIAKAWDEIPLHDEGSILSALVSSIDVQFFYKFDDANHEKLRQVYNYSLVFAFSKFKKFNPPRVEQLYESFYEVIKSTQIIKVDNFIMNVASWIDFESTFLSSYCFDDNFLPVLRNGKLDFDFKSRKEYELWLKDTERYLVNTQRYLVEAMQIYDYQDEMGELDIPKGRSEMYENINHNLYLRSWQSTLFLKDLNIENLISPQQEVHSTKCLQALMSFAFNRRFRYIEHMKALLNRGLIWFNACIHNLKVASDSKIKIPPSPILYLSKQELIDIYKDSLRNPKDGKLLLEDGEIQDLIYHFSYVLKSGEKFDPFRIQYSVMESPFLRLGSNIFIPISFFATNNWFYSIAQRGLGIYANQFHEQKRTETAGDMEKKLGESLEKHSWQVKVIEDKETNKIDGDIDLFVDDGKTQLLIQLKRTKFKLDLASNYKDALETDLKARGQLNDAVEFLKLNPIDGMPILSNHEKWVVSTSFEGVLSEVDGCVKVNYFDLIWALKYKKFSTIKELIEYIKADRPFLDCRHYLDMEF